MLIQQQRATILTTSTYYFLVYFGFGAMYPLLSVYLREEIHLSGTQIGIILSAESVVMLLTQPLWGILCDYTRKTHAILMIALVAAGISGVSLLAFDFFSAILAVAIGLAFFQGAINPLSDSITLSYVAREGLDYGSLRLWGAVGFAVAAWVMGILSDEWGLSVIFFTFTLVLFMSAMLARNLPRENVSLHLDLRSGLSRLIRLPRFLLFLLAVFCITGPILGNNVYFGLFYQERGGTIAGIGLSFLIGAGSEVPFMRWSGAWIRKRGLLVMMIAASLVAGVRWILFYFEPSLAWVYILTLTQGFSVGILIPAALQYVQAISPPDVKTTAISLHSAVSAGLGNCFFVLMGGVLLDRLSIFSVYLFYGSFTLIGVLLLLGLQFTQKQTIR